MQIQKKKIRKEGVQKLNKEGGVFLLQEQVFKLPYSSWSLLADGTSWL